MATLGVGPKTWSDPNSYGNESGQRIQDKDFMQGASRVTPGNRYRFTVQPLGAPTERFWFAISCGRILKKRLSSTPPEVWGAEPP
jgi:hypothetical protein